MEIQFINYRWTRKDKRLITANTLFLLNNNNLNDNNLKKNIYISKLLNKKILFINKHYRNYKQKINNKLQKSIKRLFFNRSFKDIVLADDLIRKIFESRKILK